MKDQRETSFIFLLFLLIAFVITMAFYTGCDKHRHHKRILAEKEELKIYRVHKVDDDTWIYWYIFMNNNTHNYYYASSPTYVQYSSLSWTRSASIPQELDKQTPIEEESVETQDLGQEAVAEVSADENSLDSMEGVPESSESSSEASSSDSGSSSSDSSSSGDSGGGDGGGSD